MNAVLRAENLTCSRLLRDGERSRLQGVSLSIEQGTLNMICGRNGCGRNLLLRLLGLLDTPDSGEVFLHGAPTSQLDHGMRAGVRSQHFGFIFADPFLLPSLTVLENIAVPLMKISASSAGEAQTRTRALLEFIGLPHASALAVETLSRADQQRVSLARALINRPAFLIAEDLDATLPDPELASLLELLRETVAEFGVTVLLSSTVPSSRADRLIEMSCGTIARDSALLAN